MVKCITLKNGITKLNGVRGFVRHIEVIGQAVSEGGEAATQSIDIYRNSPPVKSCKANIAEDSESGCKLTNGVAMLKILTGPLTGSRMTKSWNVGDREYLGVSNTDYFECNIHEIDSGNIVVRVFIED